MMGIVLQYIIAEQNALTVAGLVRTLPSGGSH